MDYWKKIDACKALTDEVRILKLKLAEEKMLRRKAITEISNKHHITRELVTDFVENDPNNQKMIQYQNKCMEQCLSSRNFFTTNQTIVVNNNNAQNSKSTTVINPQTPVRGDANNITNNNNAKSTESTTIINTTTPIVKTPGGSSLTITKLSSKSKVNSPSTNAQTKRRLSGSIDADSALSILNN